MMSNVTKELARLLVDKIHTGEINTYTTINTMESIINEVIDKQMEEDEDLWNLETPIGEIK